MAFAFSVDELKMSRAVHGTDLVDPLEQNLAVGRFCHKDKGHGVFFKRVHERLLGVKSVGGNNDGKFRMRRSDLCKNPFACIDLAVLLGGSIAVLDRFRKKRKRLTDVRMNDNGLQNLMMTADRSLGRPGFQAAGAADFLGRKIFRSIDGNKILFIEKPKPIKLPAALQKADKGWENTAQRLCRRPIGNSSHLCVFWNRANVKYRAKVVDLRLFLQSPLEGQKRGGLKKHHGKAAHQHIVQTMADLSGLARIIDLPEVLSNGGS